MDSHTHVWSAPEGVDRYCGGCGLIEARFKRPRGIELDGVRYSSLSDRGIAARAGEIIERALKAIGL